MSAKERNEHEALCPRCGADAQWLFLDPEKSRVEVNCGDCGRYEMTKEEFDQAAVDSAELSDAEAGG